MLTELWRLNNPPDSHRRRHSVTLLVGLFALLWKWEVHFTEYAEEFAKWHQHIF